MPTSDEDIRRAVEELASTEYPKADLGEAAIFAQLYAYEGDKLFDTERTILDITKANFAVFGAVMLVGSTPFFAEGVTKAWAVIMSTLTICIISLAASALATFYHKYFSVHRQKVSILQRGVWRRRPLHWIQTKYIAEDLKAQFENSASLGIREYVLYNYTLKWINLIPLSVALIVAIGYGLFGGGD